MNKTELRRALTHMKHARCADCNDNCLMKKGERWCPVQIEIIINVVEMLDKPDPYDCAGLSCDMED